MNENFSKNITWTITGLIGLLCVSATSLAAPGGNGGKPVDASFSVDLPLGYWNPSSCPFPINVTVTGNAKRIELPDNRVIINAPRQQAVVTNLDNPEKKVSLDITGVTHQSINALGQNVTVITGRNLAGDPDAGLVLSIGNFSFIFDSTNHSTGQKFSIQVSMLDQPSRFRNRTTASL